LSTSGPASAFRFFSAAIALVAFLDVQGSQDVLIPTGGAGQVAGVGRRGRPESGLSTGVSEADTIDQGIFIVHEVPAVGRKVSLFDVPAIGLIIEVLTVGSVILILVHDGTSVCVFERP
jgi:hypothetical protein